MLRCALSLHEYGMEDELFDVLPLFFGGSRGVVGDLFGVRGEEVRFRRPILPRISTLGVCCNLQAGPLGGGVIDPISG